MGLGFAEWFNWSSESDERVAAQFYRHVDPTDLAERDPETVVGAVRHTIEVARFLPSDEAVVHVSHPTLATDGWTCGRTVLTVVAEDMPFLVDSTTAELTRLGVGIHMVVHPVLSVVRDDNGRLVRADAPGPDSASSLSGPGTVDGLESWIHIEVDRQLDESARLRIAENVARVLRDVRDAVGDWPGMVAQARGLAARLVADPPRGISVEDRTDAIDLLNWLADDHFTFVGYRFYRLEGRPDHPEELALVADPGSGLGLLRTEASTSDSFAELSPQVRSRALIPRLLQVSKANRRSTVHRPVYLDHVGVQSIDRHGRVVGEHRFLGLLSAAAYTQSVEVIPVLARKASVVREALGYRRGSHSGRDLMQFLETYPRDELFAIDSDELSLVAEQVLYLKERRATRLFVRRDQFDRFLSCLVYLPRDRYTTDVRLRIQQILLEAAGASSVDYTVRLTESVLARLHVVVRMARGQSAPELEVEVVEERIAEAVRSWSDRLRRALSVARSEGDVEALLGQVPRGFPEGYRAVVSPADAVGDLEELAQLRPEEPLRVRLRTAGPTSGAQANARMTLYSLGDITLAEILPVLTSLGVDVVTEQTFRIAGADGADGRPAAFIVDVGLRSPTAARLPEVRELWEAAFLAARLERAEVDGFNALVAGAGLDWRRIEVLRAYARYLRQAGSAFSREYIEQAMVANPGIAAALVQFFHLRFDPDLGPDLDGDRAAACQDLRSRVLADLDAVASLDHDRILRSYLGLMEATVRTNHFQPDRPALALKLRPGTLRDLPEPRPAAEIWVCSPRVEGVHLRFGDVARGGLRWSDRREDFRTEVLGLVKAQAVKNAVIVPVGAKGGFFAKRLPDPAVDRDAWLAEGVAAYRTFVGSLLDVTDNLVDGEVVPPPRVVRHDGDDTYLVVAADKGTATFSDIANDVAAQYGFWLGDAFASGGSHGYDHKVMGITARGAWESVREHFRSVGPDIETTPFSVVGIGDMSGDVFGNGMLLNPRMRLVAAFDHRHVFLDPDPDPASSFQERRRLFRMPRSSWADYPPARISPGGGVYPRSAKFIPISPQVALVLGIDGQPSTLRPDEVLRAILRAPVDLLWNGGIGTYVKASGETHQDAGDRANDAIRVDANELRVRVIGEGGNLGLTQRARIEAARAGVCLNTDAIDNSAGVDTSDREVNIKIVLDLATRAGALAELERDPLLRSMTDEVADLVLQDNVDQNTVLTYEASLGANLLPAQRRLVRVLAEGAGLDRRLEALPSDAELAQMAAQGRGLTRPELAVLLAYAKLDLKRALLATSVPDEGFSIPWLTDYFPGVMVERFDQQVRAHPLRRQIIATGLVNEMVDRGGTTYALRAAEETGAGAAELARAFVVATGVFELRGLWRSIDAHESDVPVPALNALRVEVQRLLDRATRWLLQTRGGTLDVAAEVERFRGTVAELAPLVPGLLIGVERERLDGRVAELVGLGAPEGLAVEVASLLDVFSLLDIVEVAQRADQEPAEVAAVYFTVSERYEVDRFLSRITALPRGDRWAALARAALRSDLYAAAAALTEQVVRATPAGEPPASRVAAWEQGNAEGLARARATIAEIGAQDSFDLATLSVALRVMRTLARQGV